MAGAARTAITGDTIGGGRASTAERIQAGVAALSPGAAIAEVGSQLAPAVCRGIAGSTLIAELSPHAAAHAAASTPAGGARR